MSKKPGHAFERSNLIDSHAILGKDFKFSFQTDDILGLYEIGATAQCSLFQRSSRHVVAVI